MFITSAYAQGAGSPPGSDLMSFAPLIVIFVVFYFMLIRPQMKRTKEMKAMLDALQKNDEVVTTGGELGRVVKVGESYVTLEIAAGVEVLVQKAAVQTVLPKGTIKAAN
ncbi:MAG: preprotein translocase subunit YajC [Burkholderiales bacterium]|nr:preprotein translocase subunit YajC [Burkholderiales bacterium]